MNLDENPSTHARTVLSKFRSLISEDENVSRKSEMFRFLALLSTVY